MPPLVVGLIGYLMAYVFVPVGVEVAAAVAFLASPLASVILTFAIAAFYLPSAALFTER